MKGTITANATVTPNIAADRCPDKPPSEQQLLKKIAALEARLAHFERSKSESDQVEQALIKSLQEWETTFNAAKDPIMLIDSQFKIVQANLSAARLFNRPLRQIIGQPCYGLLHETDSPPDNCPLQNAIRSKQHEESELYIPHKDAWFIASADPVLDDDGSITNIVYIIRDITERKKTEESLCTLNNNLEQTIRELKRSNDELCSFAHVVAHDLKSPLRAIGTLADWIVKQNADKLDQQGAKRLAVLKARVKRMSDMVDSILRYSEIGHVVHQKELVDVSSLLAQIICEMTLPRNIQISIEGKLPTVICERIRLKQVFQNLLSNAVKYMDKPQGQIKIGCVEEGNFWKFSVADNGPGIKEQYWDKIFEIFQTLAPRDKIESTGVGLTIAKKIVELYGGRIWLTSRPDEGTTFIFTWPKESGV